MSNPTAAMLVIGDEILSGRTQDTNSHHLAKALTDRGIDLIEIRVVGDDADTITRTAGYLSERVDHLFCSGGIGPTHDDITADCIAAAVGARIDVRDDARAILEAHYAGRDVKLNAARLRMARIPEGADLIDNPVSAAPGFSLGNIHVMAGVPAIFEAMLAGLLPGLVGGVPLRSVTRTVSRGEGDIAEILTQIDRAYPEVAIGSYPFQSADGVSVRIVLRSGDASALDRAVADLDGALG